MSVLLFVLRVTLSSDTRPASPCSLWPLRCSFQSLLTRLLRLLLNTNIGLTHRILSPCPRPRCSIHQSLQYSLITHCSIFSSLSAVFSIDHFAPVLSGHYVTAVHGTPEVIMLLASHCDAAGDAEYYRWVLWCAASPLSFSLTRSWSLLTGERFLMLLDHCKWRQLGGHWAAQLSSSVASVSWGQCGPIRGQCWVSSDQWEPSTGSTQPPVWPCTAVLAWLATGSATARAGVCPLTSQHLGTQICSHVYSCAFTRKNL